MEKLSTSEDIPNKEYLIGVIGLFLTFTIALVFLIFQILPAPIVGQGAPSYI